MKLFVRIFVAALSLSLTAILSGGGNWSWQGTASSVLIVLVLALALHQANFRSRVTAVGSLALLYAGLFYWDTNLEAVVYLAMNLREVLFNCLTGSISAIVAAAILVYFPPASGGDESNLIRPKTGWVWRIPLLAVAYLLLYVIAGMSVMPWIREFYAGKPMPNLSLFLPLQLFRGVLHICLALPWLFHFARSRNQAVASLALVYMALMGWAPLLLPNAMLPGAVRLAHTVEISGTNLVFGWIVVLLLFRREGTQAAVEQPLQEASTLA